MMTQARIKSFFNCDTPKKGANKHGHKRVGDIVVQAVETAEYVSPGKANRRVQAKESCKRCGEKKRTLSLFTCILYLSEV